MVGKYEEAKVKAREEYDKTKLKMKGYQQQVFSDTSETAIITTFE